MVPVYRFAAFRDEELEALEVAVSDTPSDPINERLYEEIVQEQNRRKA